MKQPAKPRSLLFITLIIALAAGAAFLIIWYASHNNASAPTSENTPDRAETDHAKQTLNQLQAYLQPTVTRQADGTVLKQTTATSAGPANKVDGYEFFVTPQGHLLTATQNNGQASNETNTTELVTAANSFFKENDFTQAPQITEGLNDTRINNTNVLCEVSEPGIHPVSIACGSLTDYPAAAKAAQPFAATYKEAQGEFPLVIADITIKDSSVAPYQQAQVQISGGRGGFTGLFYRTSADAPWKYFTGAQNSVACTEYTTADLKKAFTGDHCYNPSDDDAVVKE